MTQLSEEQRATMKRQIAETVKEIRQRQEVSISFFNDRLVRLLNDCASLLDSDSQAAANYSKLAHEIISEFNNADDPGLLRSKVAEGFANVAFSVATAMRDKCVETVQALCLRFQQAADSSRLPNDLTASRDAAAAAALARAVSELKSLTLDQVKPGDNSMESRDLSGV